MKIGILQTGHVADELQDAHGNYPEIFATFLADQGLTFENFAVVDGEFPSGPDVADGWLITGSKFGAYEGHSWIAPLEQLIRDIHATKRPLIGVCFGHQIIAQALGGRVEKFNGGWSIGLHDYDLNGTTVALNAWHQDQVTEIPPGAQVVGQTPFCANAALLYGDHIYTLQPHPEINNAYLEGLLQLKAPGVVPDPLIREAERHLEATPDAKQLADQFARFFKEKRLV